MSQTNTVLNYNAHGKQDRLLLGIGLMICGEIFFVIAGALIKELAENLPLVQIMFFRNLFGFIFISALFIKNGFSSLKSEQPFTQLLRGLVGLAAMFFMVFTYSELQLNEATLLKATTPIFIPMIAFFLLQERISILTWFAILIAFIGVVIVNANGGTNFNISIGWIAGFCAAIFSATAKVLVRKLGRTDPSKVIIFYFALIGTAVSFPFAIYQWQEMTVTLIGLVVALALLSTFGQLSVTKAYTVAAAGKIGLYGYSSLPIAAIIGWFIWQEPITTQLGIGMIVIIIAGVINLKAQR